MIEVEVHPHVQVENYTNLELKKQEINITETEVAETFEKLRQSCAKFEDASNTNPLKKGDFFTVNLKAL